jgi:pimeloyl-ACP methyl ester carboxylesterase
LVGLKPTLIFLPGMHGTAELLAPMLAVIPAEFRHRVLTYPNDRFLSYSQLLALIEEQLRDEPSIVLIAESFAGPLAAMFAAAHPGRVRALIFVGSFVAPPGPRWLRVFARAAFFHIPIPRLAIRLMGTGFAASRDLVNQVKHAIDQVPPPIMAARLRELLSTDCSETLTTYAGPVLCLAGSHDRIISANVWARVLPSRRNARLVTIKGPHLLLETKSDLVWEEIRMLPTFDGQS